MKKKEKEKVPIQKKKQKQKKLPKKVHLKERVFEMRARKRVYFGLLG